MFKKLILAVAITVATAGLALATPSECEQCHQEMTPNLVKDFNRGVMSHEMDCTACHGDAHTGNDDVAKARRKELASEAEF